MAKPYLEDLQQIVDQLKPQITLLEDVQCRHFFSGAAAYKNDEIFMSLSPKGLALKLPKTDITILIERGAKQLRYFPKAPIKKDYVVLPSQITGDNNELHIWVLKSIAFVRK